MGLFSCTKVSTRATFADDEAVLDVLEESLVVASVDTTARLAKLRGLLSDNKIAYYLVPSSDAHGSEYVADKDRRQRFISGFTGESSMAIVGQDEAALFVDGRYHDSAAKELDHNWTLYKVGLQGVPTWKEMCQTRPEGSRIGFDGSLFPAGDIAALQASGSTLIPIHDNLIDVIWDDKPALPCTRIFRQDQYAGQSAQAKVAQLRKYYQGQNGGAYVVHDLAEIAWLLNLRGGDTPFSPVFQAYIVCSDYTTELFTDQAKVGSDNEAYLSDLKVEVRPYDQIWAALKNLAENRNGQKVRCMLLASLITLPEDCACTGIGQQQRLFRYQRSARRQSKPT